MATIYNKTYRWVNGEATCVSQAVATGHGTEIDVSQFRHVGVFIIGENDDAAAAAIGTIKCKSSFKALADVNFATAQSRTNPWDYLGMYDYEDATFKDGDTGIVFAGNDVRHFELNTNSVRSINFQVSAYTSGKFTVLVYGVNNQ